MLNLFSFADQFWCVESNPTLGDSLMCGISESTFGIDFDVNQNRNGDLMTQKRY